MTESLKANSNVRPSSVRIKAGQFQIVRIYLTIFHFSKMYVDKRPLDRCACPDVSIGNRTKLTNISNLKNILR